MTDIKIGIIGGSGLYKMEALQNVAEVQVKTPFGDPSDALITGRWLLSPVTGVIIT
jgi:5'-methylthioadenosine phosphorylase